MKTIAVIPLRRPGRWVAIILVIIAAALMLDSFITNPRFQWAVVGHYLFSPPILHGLGITLALTAMAMLIGIGGGLVLAVMRLSPNPLISTASWIYVWFFRGTPVLIQLLFWFNIEALYPHIGVGPYLLNANALITPIVAATFGLGLNECAYMSEIIRAGILAVDDGQAQAAHALGMNRMQTVRRIILPQAMRMIVPPTANEAIGLLKTTSLASVITVTELLYSAQLIYSVNYLTIQLLIVASIWYLAVTTLLSIAQSWLERRFARGSQTRLGLSHG